LINSDLRNATVYVDKPSVILQIDPKLYKDTVTWLARAQLEKRANLLGCIKELQFLREGRDVLWRLAENMEQIELQPGKVVDSQYFNHQSEEDKMSFIVVEEGLLIKHRIVDFGRQARYVETESGLSLKVPRGSRNVRIGKFGPKTMFPDPAFKLCVPYPFTMEVTEPVCAYRLKYSDILSLLLTVQVKTLVAECKNEPTDAQVIDEWVQRQEAVQWEAFKRKCMKEARKQVKVERAVRNGEWGFRKAGIPKALKEHRPQTSFQRSRKILD
jgi:hypothetical protein